MAKEFKGDGGHLYVEHNKDQHDEKPYEVWYEDFCILGLGNSEIEALEDAAQQAVDISKLALDAINQLRPVTSDDATPATQAVGGSGGE